jgi:hypothetical protein
MVWWGGPLRMVKMALVLTAVWRAAPIAMARLRQMVS